MNQPKFKFGDKVRSWATEQVFIVHNIKRCTNGCYFYHPNDQYNDWVKEKELELYQEPQKKKLYAYKNECGMIQFCERQFEAMKDRANDEILRASPEYDIEYPEAK
jgi:hypothetical protein